MKRRWILLTVSAFLLWSSVSATIINIPDDYPTIQEGIDAANEHDTVLVQPGTYVENINFNGHNIVLGSVFLITGDGSYISSTIIDGSNSEPAGVIFQNGEDSTAAITGFTIENVHSTFGGIYCLSSSPTISNNIIINNAASW